MGLLHHDVTVLNFDEMYPEQQRLYQSADERIELTDVEGTNLFCSRESLMKIRRRLSARNAHGITYIGSGNYHYITYELLREAKRPFGLVLFDNHTDARQSSRLPGCLTCGSWVAEACSTIDLLQQIVMVGVHTDGLPDSPLIRQKTILVPDFADPYQLLDALHNEDVYISIDKDVLNRSDAVTDWDQGTMRLKQLIEALRVLISNKNVIGIDICGECHIPPSDIWRYSGQIRLNERANLTILETVRGRLSSTNRNGGKRSGPANKIRS